MIEARVRARGETLLLRDWTHLDYMALPFADKPTYRLLLAETLATRFSVVNTTTVRHPIDEWNSLRKLDAMREKLTLVTYLDGYRRFAGEAARLGFVRYENFTRDPASAIKTLCGRLELSFDPTFRELQADYLTITGDTARGDNHPTRRSAIEPALIEEIGAGPAYREAIALLGYTHPE